MNVNIVTSEEVKLNGGHSRYNKQIGQTVVHIEQDELSLGLYLMEHDMDYIAGSCFHLKIYWIFARGPALKQNVVSRLTARIKEHSNDEFVIMPISGIIKQQELNPFESSVEVRRASTSESIAFFCYHF